MGNWCMYKTHLNFFFHPLSFPSFPIYFISWLPSLFQKFDFLLSYYLHFILLFNLFTFWVSLIRATMHYLNLCVWLISLNFMILRCIHFPTNDSKLLFAFSSKNKLINLLCSGRLWWHNIKLLDILTFSC